MKTYLSADPFTGVVEITADSFTEQDQDDILTPEDFIEALKGNEPIFCEIDVDGPVYQDIDDEYGIAKMRI